MPFFTRAKCLLTIGENSRVGFIFVSAAKGLLGLSFSVFCFVGFFLSFNSKRRTLQVLSAMGGGNTLGSPYMLMSGRMGMSSMSGMSTGVAGGVSFFALVFDFDAGRRALAGFFGAGASTTRSAVRLRRVLGGSGSVTVASSISTIGGGIVSTLVTVAVVSSAFLAFLLARVVRADGTSIPDESEVFVCRLT